MAASNPAPRARRGSRVSSVEEDVGRRLRAHRERSQLSLRELARRLGISPSAVSQIETGKSLPSVSTLYAIVSELGMSLDELFSGSPPRPVAAPKAAGPKSPPRRAKGHRSPVVAEPAAESDGRVQRKGTRKAIQLESGVRWERLTPTSDPDADFLYVVYDVGGSSCQDERFIRHSGREYGLVLSGTLQVTVGFDSYTLGPGDSICFDSTIPHCLTNVGTEPVHGVWFVVGRQDDSRRLAFEDAARSARES